MYLDGDDIERAMHWACGVTGEFVSDKWTDNSRKAKAFGVVLIKLNLKLGDYEWISSFRNIGGRI